MAMKLIFAGGGTGGHIFPAIAIANALRKLDPTIEILFVGAKGKMEMEKVPQAGYPIEGLDIAGFNRSSLLKNIWLPFKLIKSFFQVRRIFSGFHPDAVLGVGGYSSFPVLRLAQQRGIRSFIHESNSFAGKSNILLGKRATRIFVASEGMEKFFPKEKILVTGNPVRAAITQIYAGREEALKFFDLQPERKTVLAVGGSLGAKSINEALDSALNGFEEKGIQLIWQTGKMYAARAAEAAKNKTGVYSSPFISEMDFAYAAADVVISRAGAMAIAELCVLGKPAILVPYPFAAEDHQTANAMNLVNHNAAIMVKDGETKEKLVSITLDLVNDKNRIEELSGNIKKMGVSDADARIAMEIMEQVKSGS
jgi:UDP-N-acetylglucosamine--N-acetylmuramyl-(pentapeptide) pyrophosphoryl-undecaprenol N-acetylglucosamine transferase